MTHAVFWNERWTLFLKSVKEVSTQITVLESSKLDEENWFFHDARKNDFKFMTEQKWMKYDFIVGPTKYTLFL